jgi:L-fuculose-phosphate aldolase
MQLGEVRRAVVAQFLELERDGLVSAAAGSVSAREGERIVIVPSGSSDQRDACDDMAVIDLDGAADESTSQFERELHLAIYRARPDVRAVVSTGSRFATVLAVLGWPVPAVHYGIAALGTTEVPVVEAGTDAVSAALATGTRAVLVAHQGAAAFGPDLATAASLARRLETLAHLYYHARAAGDPVILPGDEIEHVRELYRTHGQPPGR